MIILIFPILEQGKENRAVNKHCPFLYLLSI